MIGLGRFNHAVYRSAGFRTIDAGDGQRYQYLTNNVDFEPGVIIFRYQRRWDIEKYLDNFKNDMANAKARGKSLAGRGFAYFDATVLLIKSPLISGCPIAIPHKN